MAPTTHSLFIAVVLSGILSCPAHSAEADNKPHPKEAAKKSGISMDALIKEALSKGYETYIPNIVGSLLDLPGDIAANYIEVSTGETTDSMDHGLKLALLEASTNQTLTPLKFVFTTYNDLPGNRDNYHFKAGLDGSLEKAILLTGKLDKNGKTVKGSGVVAEKDIASPEIKERFRHELDFWLKGAYRKKAVANR